MIFDALRRWLGRGEPPAAAPRERPGCEEALARIYEFLDGELESMSHEQVDEHFRLCQACYPHLRLEERFREAIHRAVDGEDECPERIKRRILELVEEGELDIPRPS